MSKIEEALNKAKKNKSNKITSLKVVDNSSKKHQLSGMRDLIPSKAISNNIEINHESS